MQDTTIWGSKNSAHSFVTLAGYRGASLQNTCFVFNVDHAFEFVYNVQKLDLFYSHEQSRSRVLTRVPRLCNQYTHNITKTVEFQQIR